MFRAGLTFLRRLLCAAILLVLIVCGAEVGVRIFEVVGGTDVCATATSPCAVDPTGLLMPSWTTYRELKPHALTTVKCRDSKRDVPIRTNSLGLRGPEVIVPKPSGRFRIVLLGDETIFAPETLEADHAARALKELLQQQTQVPIEVVNAGRAFRGRRAALEYEDDFGGTRLKVQSYLYQFCWAGEDWIVKYRFTYPAGIRGTRPLDELLAGIRWP